MSLLLRTIEAFPLGRTTEQLFALLDVDFEHRKRQALLAELDELVTNGRISRGRDGRWRAVPPQPRIAPRMPSSRPQPAGTVEVLTAAPATFREHPLPDEDQSSEVDPTGKIDPAALLRYWRAALRSDPRGAITETEERHGTSWHLITGAGPVVAAEQNRLTITVKTDDLAPSFRQTLLSRAANEQALALGWPMAVGRKNGAPAIWPVGLLSVTWERVGGDLTLSLDARDVLVNPEWVRGSARGAGLSPSALHGLFASSDGEPLVFDDFIDRLREAMAGQMRGRLTDRNLASTLDPASVGIYNVAGLFLPTESSFTAGAVRDLDAIAAWPTDRLAETALAPILGLVHRAETIAVPTLQTDTLNAEQISAVRKACSLPLTVVTGPPGTGKSQAIVAMAASVLAAGGSVLVASKNHQALEAVETRLGGIAPDAQFLVRTIDPEREIDQSFNDVLRQMTIAQPATGRPVDPELKSRLATLGLQRNEALDASDRFATLQCKIAALIERIGLREAHVDAALLEPVAAERRRFLDWLIRLLAIFRRRSAKQDSAPDAEGASTEQLREHLEVLRVQADRLKPLKDPVELSGKIVELARSILPTILNARANLTPEQQEALAEVLAELEFSGRDINHSGDLARRVTHHRPLWLASVLGAPKRIPLDAGLFDLVIFDEASQCDIASALPLFARARRAVVVGDNKQLSFIPQIGLVQDRNLMLAQGLPSQGMARFAQSRQSLFDMAFRVPGAEKVLLRDQYRSVEGIVDYISENFYAGMLRPAYDAARMKPVPGMKPGLAWTDVPGPAVAGAGNVNSAEVKAIAQHLRVLLVDQGYEGSVGVISPFRQQVQALKEAIEAQVPEPVAQAADLRIGTVDAFQGQERDLILFSPCVSASSAQTAATFLNKDARRLNVAISRARFAAHVFGDLTYARAGSNGNLARLAARATEPRRIKTSDPFESGWERRMFHALKSVGLDPVPQYEIAGRRLDFALFGADGIKLDLEVDGRLWHEDSQGRRKVSDHWRDQQLRSLGWRVRRFWVDELAKDMEGCLELVKRDLS